MFDIVLELRDQGIDAVELALATQEVGETHTCCLAIEIIAEVEKVRFEQRVIGVLVERGAPTEVDGATKRRAVGAFVPTGIHTIGRHTDLIRHLDVGCRETEQAPALVAEHDSSAYLEGVTEHVVGELYLPPGQGTANRSGADRLVDPIGARDKFARMHREVVQRAEFTEQCNVSRTLPPEVEVLAHHDGLCGQAIDQNALDEVGGTLKRLLFVETYKHRRVDTGGGEELEFLVEVGEQFRRRLGPYDARRMTIEGHHNRAAAEFRRQLLHLSDYCLMPEMHAVIRTDRDDRAFTWPRRLREVSDHLHDSRR